LAEPVRGDVVVVPFPFSDLTQVKKRPALVIASPAGSDILPCQITSKDVRDEYAVSISDADFAEGKLSQPGNVRPNKVFTADPAIVLYRAGSLKPRKMQEITEQIVRLLSAQGGQAGRRGTTVKRVLWPRMR
jgi:mRNA interferase MazF